MKTALKSAVKGKLMPLTTLITIRFVYTEGVKYSFLHRIVPVKGQRSKISDTVLLGEDMELAIGILRSAERRSVQYKGISGSQTWAVFLFFVLLV